MARGHVVRGTPVHHIHNPHEGISPRTPAHMEGTVHSQYDSDRRGYQHERDGGTPYHSEEGNGPEFRRVRAHGTNVESADHGNQNDPHSNGRAVMLDVGDQASGYAPKHEPTMDSPVPEHAPVFDRRFISKEDAAHQGSGNEHLAGDGVNNDLRRLNGVMSRGLDSTSHPDEDERELTRDDTLAKPEAGTQMDVQGRREKPIRE